MLFYNFSSTSVPSKAARHTSATARQFPSGPEAMWIVQRVRVWIENIEEGQAGPAEGVITHCCLVRGGRAEHHATRAGDGLSCRAPLRWPQPPRAPLTYPVHVLPLNYVQAPAAMGAQLHRLELPAASAVRLPRGKGHHSPAPPEELSVPSAHMVNLAAVHWEPLEAPCAQQSPMCTPARAEAAEGGGSTGGLLRSDSGRRGASSSGTAAGDAVWAAQDLSGPQDVVGR